MGHCSGANDFGLVYDIIRHSIWHETIKRSCEKSLTYHFVISRLQNHFFGEWLYKKEGILVLFSYFKRSMCLSPLENDVTTGYIFTFIISELELTQYKNGSIRSKTNKFWNCRVFSLTVQTIFGKYFVEEEYIYFSTTTFFCKIYEMDRNDLTFVDRVILSDFKKSFFSHTAFLCHISLYKRFHL